LDSRERSPLLGHKLESSLQPGTFLWETDLEIAMLPYLGDHRVLRSAVFPAAAHIDMALSAAKSLMPDENFEVRTRGDDGEDPWPLRSKGILQRAESDPKAILNVALTDLQRQYGIRRSGEEHRDITV